MSRSLKSVSKLDCLIFDSPTTKIKQAMWLDPCEVIYLGISLLSISYHFSVPVIIYAVILLYGFFVSFLVSISLVFTSELENDCPTI